jgi:peptidyl-tRNA hydrolase, PTH1 family
MEDASPNPTSEIRIPKSPWLVVGLGNPGAEYADTYHNVGFRVVGRMAEAQGKRINIGCGPAMISAKILIAGQQAVLVAPQTYMNNSGAALPVVFERFDAGPKDLIVIYDDLDLPIGKLRIRQKGSAGTHNGIKSIISTLGADEFLRIRVGIQPDRPTGDVRDFVLSRVAKGDCDLLFQTEVIAERAVDTLVADGIEKAMATYNGIDLREEEKET